MMRFSDMNVMRGALLLALPFLAFACGRNETTASKSAAAYREAQAKGAPVAGGHDHGSHGAATASAAADPHAGHNMTAADPHAGHNMTAADPHAGHNMTAADPHAGHDMSASGGMDHSAHRAMPAADHAAMGHGAAAGDAHAGHPQARGRATDHSAHGTAPADAHAQHGGTAAATDAHAGHAQHGAMPTAPATGGPNANAHARHGMAGITAAPATAPAPRTNAEMQRLQPAATLRSDAFDAPAPASVSEAAKAAQGGNDR